MYHLSKWLTVSAAVALLATPAAYAKEKAQEWNLINPAGVIKVTAVQPAKRITSLEGKTIALRWNGKHNGDVVLDRLGDLLEKKYPTAKIERTYRTMASQNVSKISSTQAESMRITKAITSVKPDLVIASQCD